MKKKNIIIVSVIASILIIILLIVIFINNINKDKNKQEENIETINKCYEKFAGEIEIYNNLRTDILNFINNFYYDTIENNYSTNLEMLNKYDEVVNKVTKEINVLDSKCNMIYKDQKINNICNNYKKDYETIINIFVNDINSYNNKLNSYNKDNNKNLELFKSKYINDYIDYNNDNEYTKKDEVDD